MSLDIFTQSQRDGLDFAQQHLAHTLPDPPLDLFPWVVLVLTILTFIAFLLANRALDRARTREADLSLSGLAAGLILWICGSARAMSDPVRRFAADVRVKVQKGQSQ